jgi:protein-disulfide isomerase
MSRKYLLPKNPKDWKSQQSKIIYSILIVTALVLVIAILGVQRILPNEKQGAGNSATLADPSLGYDDASITIIEFGDFGCTTCKAWNQAAIKEKVIIEYVESVRFVWKDFPVITPQSPMAAEAAQCAHEQGKFWVYHNHLYDRQPKFKIEELKNYAIELDLNTQQFNQCLDSRKYQADVEADLQEAIEHGFRGTPSFLINGEPLIGPPTYGMIDGRIQEILGTEN